MQLQASQLFVQSNSAIANASKPVTQQLYFSASGQAVRYEEHYDANAVATSVLDTIEQKVLPQKKGQAVATPLKLPIWENGSTTQKLVRFTFNYPKAGTPSETESKTGLENAKSDMYAIEGFPNYKTKTIEPGKKYTWYFNNPRQQQDLEAGQQDVNADCLVLELRKGQPPKLRLLHETGTELREDATPAPTFREDEITDPEKIQRAKKLFEELESTHGPKCPFATMIGAIKSIPSQIKLG